MSGVGDGERHGPRRSRPSIQVGRLLARGFTAFLLVFAAAGAAGEEPSFSAEAIGVVVVLALAVLAVAIAWWSASPGVYALALAGLAFVFLVAATAETDQVAGTLTTGGPYFLSAALVWFGVWRLPTA